MPRKLHNALTPLAVKNAKPGRHADGGGLHLLVKPTGARSWVYRFMLGGKSRDVGLGTAGQGGMSLADARDEAAALRLKVKAGIDPLEERDREAAQALAAAPCGQNSGKVAFLSLFLACFLPQRHGRDGGSTPDVRGGPAVGAD